MQLTSTNRMSFWKSNCFDLHWHREKNQVGPWLKYCFHKQTFHLGAAWYFFNPNSYVHSISSWIFCMKLCGCVFGKTKMFKSEKGGVFIACIWEVAIGWLLGDPSNMHKRPWDPSCLVTTKGIQEVNLHLSRANLEPTCIARDTYLEMVVMRVTWLIITRSCWRIFCPTSLMKPFGNGDLLFQRLKIKDLPFLASQTKKVKQSFFCHNWDSKFCILMQLG